MTDFKISLVPLNGKNYPTWKVQCRMALVKDSLWDIVRGTETLAEDATDEARKKFVARSDRALAVIVLAVDPSLLYLLGEPENPGTVWKRLEEQFQRKTWANKLHLRRKLYALRLKEGGSVNEHIKVMTEIFEALAVIGDAVSEEDRVVHLLASLPESFNVLVTALEAQSENVPKWAVVTERLLHEQIKMTEKTPMYSPGEEGRKALFATKQRSGQKHKFTCHFCQKPGHFKKDCRKFLASQKFKQDAKTAETLKKEESDTEVFVTSQALVTVSKGRWIVDSGATCHMCNDESQFIELKQLETIQKVRLGDGRLLDGIAEGTVKLETLLPDGKTKNCKMENVLFVPKLSYSLLSVSKASNAGKTTVFDRSGCQILNEQKKVIAFATRVGNLYNLEHCKPKTQLANTANKANKEKLWHRRYGHLGEQNLQKIAREELAEKFNYDPSNEIGFCETCIGGKHHRSPFSRSTTQTTEILELVHSDVCQERYRRSPLEEENTFCHSQTTNLGTRGCMY